MLHQGKGQPITKAAKHQYLPLSKTTNNVNNSSVLPNSSQEDSVSIPIIISNIQTSSSLNDQSCEYLSSDDEDISPKELFKTFLNKSPAKRTSPIGEEIELISSWNNRRRMKGSSENGSQSNFPSVKELVRNISVKQDAELTRAKFSTSPVELRLSRRRTQTSVSTLESIDEVEDIDDDEYVKIPSCSSCEDCHNFRLRVNTIQDARKWANQIGFTSNEDDASDTTPLPPLLRANPTEHRLCWARGCWSKQYHSHPQNLSRNRKTNLREKLQHASISSNYAISAFNFGKQKAKKKMKDLITFFKELKDIIIIWPESLKKIEGSYGNGVVSVFLLIRWLLYMNMAASVLVLLGIILPELIFNSVLLAGEPPRNGEIEYVLRWKPPSNAPPELPITPLDYLLNITSGNISVHFNHTQCTQLYQQDVHNQIANNSFLDDIQDFIQGTGWLQLQRMFIGHYNPVTFPEIGHFSTPVAFLTINATLSIFWLAVMIRQAMKGLRETLILSKSQSQKYSNLIFCGWDCCIQEDKAAFIKHKTLVQQLKSHLEEDRRIALRAQWSNQRLLRTYVVRLLVNLGVIFLLILCALLLYHVTRITLQSIDLSARLTLHQRGVEALWTEYLPSLTITGLNMVLPFVFYYVVQLEDYAVAFQIQITLVRTVVFRLASIAVLVYSLHLQLRCQVKDFCRPFSNACPNTPACWETFVGQQVYKLALLDFFAQVASVWLLESLRRRLVIHCRCGLTEFIGRQEFDIPRNVLDMVYGQTLIWLGTFYCPFLPILGTLKLYFLFRLKKYSLFTNCVPSKIPYLASRSNHIFLVVLLLSFLITIGPLGYSIYLINPSMACGPFRVFRNMWSAIHLAVQRLPHSVKILFSFLGSTSFTCPAAIFLCLALYYYVALLSTHHKMTHVFKNHLVTETKVKQLLLAHLTQEAIQHHQ